MNTEVIINTLKTAISAAVKICGNIPGYLDTFASVCGSADTARKVILIIGLAIIFLCTKKYFKTRHKIHIIVMCIALLAFTSAACYYKPSKWPLMIPIAILAAIMLWLVLTGRGNMRVNIPIPGKSRRKGAR